MSPWLSFPVLALLVAMQVSLVPGLQVGPALPQLLVVWVICWAVIRGRGEALPWAIVAGILLDLVSSLPFGSHLIALTVVSYVADLGHRVMHGSTALFAAAAVVLASLTYGALLVLLTAGAGHQLVYLLVSRVIPGAAYNLALTVLVFPLLQWFDRRFPAPIGVEW